MANKKVQALVEFEDQVAQQRRQPGDQWSVEEWRAQELVTRKLVRPAPKAQPTKKSPGPKQDK